MYLPNTDSALDLSYIWLFCKVIKHITVFLHITVCSFIISVLSNIIGEARASCHTLLQSSE